MITRGESILHLCAAAALATGMLGVGFGALAVSRRTTSRVRWPWLIGGGLAAAMTLYVANVELRFDPTGGLLPAAFGAIAGGVIGVPLATVGLRGRFVGDHPHCRRCGFDLTGRPDSSSLCSECGADLTDARAITNGVRRRRPIPLLAGAFLAILSFAIGVAITRQTLARSGGLSIVRYEPTSWLFNDLATGTPKDQAFAGDELFRRATIGNLSAADTARFVRIAVTGNAPRSRLTLFGVMAASAAWSHGTLDEPTMRAVVRSLATATLTLAPQSLPDRVPFEIAMPELAALQMSVSNRCTIEPRDRVDAINGTTLPPMTIAGATPGPAFPGRLSIMPLTAATPFGRIYRLDPPLDAGLASVSVQMTVAVTYAVDGRPTIVEDVPIALAGSTTIVPGLTRPLVADAQPKPRMSVDALVSRGTTTPGDAARTTIQFVVRGATLRFIGDVIERTRDGRERTLGPLAIDRNFGTAETDAVLADEDALLILKPTPERGVEFVWPMTTWQHEIVIDASRIQRADRPERPPRQKR